jgi:chromosome segregation protein
MTRLKALELFGFKSFADRTRFEFPEGITVVVGPNGSGKSNVVDAIKWVLGEQSVRSLRGKEMTDVIFAGSTSRKPLNYAEVSLVFDNTAGLLPLDTTEVQIMRRVQRNGESEYLVNGETARLRDVRELFAGTGAATAAYSVIEQGRVDALLVASGKERRAVFEEAAGIGRFRLRRTEALRRLERAEVNRQRLADLVGELGIRLETVRQQAARARRWRQLTDRLRALRLAAAARDLAEVDTAVTAIERERSLSRATLAAAEARAVESAAENARLTAAAMELQPVAAAARASVAATTRQAAATEAGLAMARTRCGDLEEAALAARLDLRRTLAAEHAARTAAAAAADTVATLARHLAEVDGRLAALERSVHGSHDEATDQERRLATAVAALDANRERAVRLEAVRERVEERAEQARQAVETAHAECEIARGQTMRLTEAQAACEGSLSLLEATLKQATADLTALEASQRTALETLRTAWSDLADRRAALEACRERTTVLREMVDRNVGLSDAARQLLAAGADGVPGLLGPVADLLVAGEDWARLVDIALGPFTEGLLVESLEPAVHWHNGRGAHDAVAGRVRLVAAPSGTTAKEGTSFDGEPGVVGRLDRLLASADGDGGETTDGPERTTVEQARKALLSRIWVVERPPDALPLLAGAPPGTRFLARSGECITADGSFELGSGAAGTGLVAQRAELRGLEHRQQACVEEAEAAQRTIDELQARVDDLRSAVRDAQARRARAAETIAGTRHELTRTVRERAIAADAVAATAARLRSAEQRAAEETAALRVAVEATTAGGTALDAARAEIAAAEAAVRALVRARDAIDDEIQQLRIARATGGEKLSRGEEARHGLEMAAEHRAADVATARQAADSANRTLADHEIHVLAATAAHAEAVWALERATDALAAIDAEADAIDARRRTVADAIEAYRADSGRLAEEAHRRDLEAGEARHRRMRIIERIRDEYDLDIESLAPAAAGPEAAVPGAAAAPADPAAADMPEDRTALDREIDELRRKLGSYVSVNLDALHESEELAARLATLEGQLADVAQAKQSIEQLIERLDDDSRRLLGETIETVRIQFRELFERLFGGGQADILLEQGVDLLEAAVDIVARPPGKEPRSISLLSGGEKTMTCVALLLAIFRSRPSPFCILDEVDAALDEANVDRFSGVLRDFLSATQFIVVTHSKKTMSAANTLYGVTMEESGVSKRVSVRFESAVAVARAA